MRPQGIAVDQLAEFGPEVPLMKEELATGLVWKWLDAEAALDSGAPSDCHRIMDSVEIILAPASSDGSEQ